MPVCYRWHRCFIGTVLFLPDIAAGLAAPPASEYGVATGPALAAIDWSQRPSATSTGRSPSADAALQRANDRWQQRFVNHLGATAERLNPNAGLKVHLPIAARVSTL